MSRSPKDKRRKILKATKTGTISFDMAKAAAKIRKPDFMKQIRKKAQ